jgi:hypothetical protein
MSKNKKIRIVIQITTEICRSYCVKINFPYHKMLDIVCRRQGRHNKHLNWYSPYLLRTVTGLFFRHGQQEDVSL